MRLFALKTATKPTALAWIPPAFFRMVSVCRSAALGLGLLGFVAGIHAQAASPDSGNTAKGHDNPTADLQLIDLNASEAPVNKSLDDLSEIDMVSAADETEGWTDDIDAQRDLSALDDSDVSYAEVPEDVAQVSLSAISPETLKTFVAAIDLVRKEYIEPVNDETLFNNAMSGMLTKLDSHAEFLDAEAYENLRAFTQGDVGDIGVSAEYHSDEGHWVITQVLPDSHADKKGIVVGDYLHQIDEFKLDEYKQANDIKQLLNGIAGTQVDVITSKAGRRKRTVTLQRNNSHPQTIDIKLVDRMAVIKLPAFQDNSREQILHSLASLEAPVAGILLDLRDNPGGVLTSAVKVASLFMSDKEVVQVKSRQDPLHILSTQGNAVLKPLPVVVLQNRYSASAAEVVASSLQTQKRATIVGEVSYGKGSVQSVLPLNDEQAIKLTVAHYLTPTGRDIDKVGVQPDVSLSGEQNMWEHQALELLSQQLHSSGIRFVRKGQAEQDASTQNSIQQETAP
ncbi:S41 family peptidase [Psychrobacter sp. F1192]|uniref:S41 family peptidase n=1 Tax=Psychrobacter coccoides TaxID=2818440 RepID=A0ABS3NRX1_9GAMM|nr:S41 family peptidase [Psychrobacter coccoides]MBO1531795.1 S41 family peptidase [Psychrobacter coccoides]